MKDSFFLTDAQLKAELLKCEYCEEKPCREGCPAHCSPADFIMAAQVGSPSDLKRAAAAIMTYNPFGGVCGLVCPEKHCQRACVRMGFDHPVNIPAVQATIIARAKEILGMPKLETCKSNGKKIAVIGAGPAGMGAAVFLAQKGYTVDIYEKRAKAGGTCLLIPDHRLPKDVVESDIKFALSVPLIHLKPNTHIDDPQKLLDKGYGAVIVAIGLPDPIKLGISGEELATPGTDYLWNPSAYPMSGRVAVIGGGATACDTAVTAIKRGAQAVEMFALEKVSEMPLTDKERKELIDHGVEINGRVRVTAINTQNKKITGVTTIKVTLPHGEPFSLAKITNLPGTEQQRNGIDHVLVSIGTRASLKRSNNPAVFYSGDYENGPTTVVEASAAGKNTGAEVDAWLSKGPKPVFEKRTKSRIGISGYSFIPVPLETDFFDRKILSPFLLSAAPPSDGYDQMKKAYEAGWAGGVMKTSFDNVPIHIPAEYMHAFSVKTWGNCDNVSGHPLDRVCHEVKSLVREFPDRLTMASTGGPVTGNDENDRKGWQSNTKKLEAAGVMGIEYSLSCPQGGDGTEGDIVSQNASLTAKIIDWIMEVSDPNIPKLFKLTAAVTSIIPIMNAIKDVLDRYPGKKAGVTLANTFPTLFFRKGQKQEWEEGIIVGMSGEGVIPISNLTLAKVSGLGISVSGNGGPMDYKSAADFLALGAKTVQFCTVVMKYGYAIINDLHYGLSHLLKERGIPSVPALIGIALPKPVTDFMALSPVKKISACNQDICVSCGNCTRCPYLAVQLTTVDKKKNPVTDPAKCIGCSICVQKCISGALYMRERTPEERASLKEI